MIPNQNQKMLPFRLSQAHLGQIPEWFFEETMEEWSKFLNAIRDRGNRYRLTKNKNVPPTKNKDRVQVLLSRVRALLDKK